MGQTTCDPEAKPGVIGFRDLLKAEYGRADLGMVRACDVGGQSEHKEGRALDYPSVPRRPGRVHGQSAGAQWKRRSRVRRPVARLDVAEERETWPVIRQKLRFIGVTTRKKTSPNTWRTIARAIDGEPALSEPWLRTLVRQLNA